MSVVVYWGGQAAKVTTGSEPNYRNNFLSYFPDDRTPEERAAQWEETKRHMDEVGASFPGKSFSQVYDELEHKDRDFIAAMLKRWKESLEHLTYFPFVIRSYSCRSGRY